MPTRYELIRTEIDTDPAHRGYAGHYANEIADLMNEPLDTGTTTWQPMSAKLCLDIISDASFADIDASAKNLQAPGHAASVLFQSYMNLVGEIEMVPGSSGRECLNTLRSNSLITVMELTMLEDTAEVPVMKSRGETIGVGVVTEEDVMLAWGV